MCLLLSDEVTLHKPVPHKGLSGRPSGLKEVGFVGKAANVWIDEHGGREGGLPSSWGDVIEGSQKLCP